MTQSTPATRQLELFAPPDNQKTRLLIGDVLTVFIDQQSLL